jgi:hypothetical protein
MRFSLPVGQYLTKLDLVVGDLVVGSCASTSMSTNPEGAPGANFALVYFGLGSLVHASIVIWPSRERMKKLLFYFVVLIMVGVRCIMVLVFAIFIYGVSKSTRKRGNTQQMHSLRSVI